MPSDERWDLKPKSKTKPWRPGWQSRIAPGTPQNLEALFDMINKGNSGTGAFKFARSLFEYLTDEDIWQAYDHWIEGKLDPTVIEKKTKWERNKPL